MTVNGSARQLLCNLHWQTYNIAEYRGSALHIPKSFGLNKANSTQLDLKLGRSSANTLIRFMVRNLIGKIVEFSKVITKQNSSSNCRSAPYFIDFHTSKISDTSVYKYLIWKNIEIPAFTNLSLHELSKSDKRNISELRLNQKEAKTTYTFKDSGRNFLRSLKMEAL